MYRDRYAAGKVNPSVQLAKLGYKFDSNLELRSISSGEKYSWVDQATYEVVGDAVCNFLEDFLVTHYGFLKKYSPNQC